MIEGNSENIYTLDNFIQEYGAEDLRVDAFHLKEVFFDTEDEVFPPNIFILAPASSLVMLSNVPVKTKVNPASLSETFSEPS